MRRALALFLAVLSGCGRAGLGRAGSRMPSARAGSATPAGMLAAGSSRLPVGERDLVSPAFSSARVYVGSSNGQISIYKLDAELGRLTFLNSVAAGNYPSFVAFDPAHTHAYAVNEADGMVASFTVDAASGALTFLNRVDSGGAGPTFVAVDRGGAYVMVANYNGGTTRVLRVAADGSLGAPSDDKAPGLNSHMIITDPANKFAFVMNLGSDTVAEYAFDAVTGTLRPNSVPVISTTKGAGPRHLAFHPNGKLAYLVGELDHTVSAYSYDAARGQLGFLQTLSSVPADGNTAVRGAEVVAAPSGRFVYSSNRAAAGPGSIARFAVDSQTGMLTLLGATPSGGNVPRSFTLSADGKLMLVANESGAVVSFSVDTESGMLTKLFSIDAPQKPEFVGIVQLTAAPLR